MLRHWITAYTVDEPICVPVVLQNRCPLSRFQILWFVSFLFMSLVAWMTCVALHVACPSNDNTFHQVNRRTWSTKQNVIIMTKVHFGCDYCFWHLFRSIIRQDHSLKHMAALKNTIMLLLQSSFVHKACQVQFFLYSRSHPTFFLICYLKLSCRYYEDLYLLFVEALSR